MGLYFDTASRVAPAATERADVACFVGFVARRRRASLPPAVREQLAADGWVHGPWQRGEAALDSLLNLPVVIDSWGVFDTLFAWDQRPLERTSGAVCASYLGAAVRRFFAAGGKRAVVVRVGDPWPLLEPDTHRLARRRARLARLLPTLADEERAGRLFDPTRPDAWQGVEQVAGRGDVSLLCLPDLPDVCARETRPPAPLAAVAPLVEGFVDCVPPPPASDPDRGCLRLLAPRLDARGFGAWRVAVAGVRDFLARHQREVMFVGALPLARDDASRPGRAGGVHAQADPLGFLRRAGVLESEEGRAPGPLSVASALVQLGHPWLASPLARDLPESLEPPDGWLAGLVAAGARSRGTQASVAGAGSRPALASVGASWPEPSGGEGADAPRERLARRLCVFAPSPEGWTLTSDVTTSADPAWREGGASRLLGALRRAARRRGEAVLYEPNGPAAWRQLRAGLEDLLTDFWRAGTLQGATPAEAFEVRCDATTMTLQDREQGRLVARMSVRPAGSVRHLTFHLALGAAAAAREPLDAAVA